MTGRWLTRNRLLLAGITALLVVVTVYSAAVPGTADHGSLPVEERNGTHMVAPVENGSLLWPYTGSGQSTAKRSLAINMIVYGDHEQIRRQFRDGRTLNWTAEPFGGTQADDVVPEDVRDVIWRDAHGSDRYTMVEQADGERMWLDESYQVYDGDYLGERYHIRAYESPNPDEEWTAMQAHEEYFDFFRLKHTVTSANTAQRHAEAEFLASADARLEQVYLDNPVGSDADGWVTIIEFGLLAFGVGLFGSGVGRQAATRLTSLRETLGRNRLHAALLAISVVLTYLGVRFLGLWLEGILRGLNPQLLNVVLYPLLAVGVPVVAHLLARPVDARDAFLVAGGALLVAVGLDFSVIGVTAIPREIILHRALMAVSLGLIGASSSINEAGGARRNVLLLYGAAGWVVGLMLPLAGLI